MENGQENKAKEPEVVRTDSGREIWLRQIHIAGIRGEVFDICIKDGRFQQIRMVQEPPAAGECPEKGGQFWIAPGLIDLHFHAGWTDFIHSVQEKRTEEEVQSMIRREMKRLLKTGVTMVRDAGGLTGENWRECRRGVPETEVFPEVILCADMIPARAGIAFEGLESVLQSSQEWVKVMATGGISTETEHVLEADASGADVKKLIRVLHDHGKRVMVHTWGGPVLDWLIDAGVDSVEHGVFMTRQQAKGLAEKHIPYVATSRIYQMIAAGQEPLVVPPFLRERAERACGAHRKAVRYALEEGVEMGFGTDFYSGDNLIPKELEELFSLREYGLSAAGAWKAATETAARILGLSSSHGRIAQGFAADAIVFRGDPYRAESAAALRESMVRVYKC